MNNGIQIVVYPVADLAQAKAQFGKLLGVEPYVDSPYYVGYKLGNMEIGLDPNGHKHGRKGTIAWYDVSDIQAEFQALLDAGAQPEEKPHDVGGGLLVASVIDPSGNRIGVRQES